MKKLLLLYFLIFQSILFGCAACQLMVPSAEVKLNLSTQKEKLTNIHIEWVFTDTYVGSLLVQYDKNRDERLDAKELQIVKQVMLEYLLANKMLTTINFAQNESTEESIKLTPEYKNFHLDIQSDILTFSYDAGMNLQLQNNSSLSFAFNDDNGFFAFVVTELQVDTQEFRYENNLYLFTASILFQDQSISAKKQQIQEHNATQNTQKNRSQSSTQSNLLQKSIAKVKTLFESIKDETNPLTYLALLFFAYIYGLIHALGPGHGKTLVASYFLSNERSYSKALFVSLAIGVVHTFSAFLLTLIIYFGVDTFLSQFINDTVYITTKISALIIITIALYLFYTKYKAYKTVQQAKFHFSTTPHTSACGCGSCKVDKDSTDLALIVSAGIIPCPGTTTLFIFAISMGLYYAGFLSALVMSLGMSTIIYFSALLSVSIRKKTSQNHQNLKKYLEYASLSIILILGLFLLLAS